MKCVCGIRVIDGLLRCGACGRLTGAKAVIDMPKRDARGRIINRNVPQRTCGRAPRGHKDKTLSALARHGMVPGYRNDSGEDGKSGDME